MGSHARYRYERVRQRNKDGSTTFGLELVSYSGADPLTAEPIIINVADIKPCHYDWLTEMLLKGACLVVNNTDKAIDKVRYLIQNGRGASLKPGVRFLHFVLTIDEADDFIRTDM